MPALQYKEFSSKSTPNPGVSHVKWLAVAVALGAIVAFCPILSNDFISLDDGNLVARNPDFNPPQPSHWVHYWTGPTQQAYHPTELYMPLTYTLWGGVAYLAQNTDDDQHMSLGPGVYHGLSLLLHAVNAILVYFVLRRLVAGDASAFFGAMLFAVHPLQTESVAWVAEISVLLSTLFSLVAMFEFMRFMALRCDTPSDGTAAIGSISAKLPWVHYLAGTLALALALLSKAPAVVVPALVLVVEVVLRKRSLRTVIPPLIPWGLLCLPIALLTHHWQISHFTVPWAQRPVVAADALAFYLYSLAWPIGLLPNYGRTPDWLMAHHAIAATSWIAPAVLFLLCVMLWRKARWVAAAALLWLVALLPFLGLNVFVYQRFSTTADRYTYLAMFGPALALASLLALMPRKLVFALVGVVSVALIGLSIRQSTFWSDSLTLFTRVIEAHPDSQKGQEQVAVAYDALASKQLANRDRQAPQTLMQAREHFLIAAKLPDDDGISYYNAGKCSMLLAEFPKAIEEFKKALADGSFPLRAMAYNQLGVCYQKLPGNSALAAEAYNNALQASNSPEFASEHKAAAEYLQRMEIDKMLRGGK